MIDKKGLWEKYSIYVFLFLPGLWLMRNHLGRYLGFAVTVDSSDRAVKAGKLFVTHFHSPTGHKPNLVRFDKELNWEKLQ